MTAEQTFHTSRLMFVLRKNEICLAPPNDTRSHTQWFIDEQWMRHEDSSFFHNAVRGYFKEGALWLYRGSDYAAIDRGTLLVLLPRLTTAFRLRNGAQIHNGVIPGEIGEQWPSIEVITYRSNRR